MTTFTVPAGSRRERADKVLAQGHHLLPTFGVGADIDFSGEKILIKANSQERAEAVLDVFQTDPLPSEHPLWHAPNTLITPRLGGLSDIYQEQFVPYLETNLGCYAADRWQEMVNVIRR